jgi:hypothetical protein
MGKRLSQANRQVECLCVQESEYARVVGVWVCVHVHLCMWSVCEIECAWIVWGMSCVLNVWVICEHELCVHLYIWVVHARVCVCVCVCLRGDWNSNHGYSSSTQVVTTTQDFTEQMTSSLNGAGAWGLALCVVGPPHPQEACSWVPKTPLHPANGSLRGHPTASGRAGARRVRARLLFLWNVTQWLQQSTWALGKSRCLVMGGLLCLSSPPYLTPYIMPSVQWRLTWLIGSMKTPPSSLSGTFQCPGLAVKTWCCLLWTMSHRVTPQRARAKLLCKGHDLPSQSGAHTHNSTWPTDSQS